MTKRSGLLEAYAECRTCGWEAESRNAVGIAAQHANRTGHHVVATQTIVTSWNRPEG